MPAARRRHSSTDADPRNFIQISHVAFAGSTNGAGDALDRSLVFWSSDVDDHSTEVAVGRLSGSLTRISIFQSPPERWR